MQVILLVVVGAINQSKYVPMMSLAVVGTLTRFLLVYAGVYAGLCGGLHGSMQVYTGLHGASMWVYGVYVGVYAGLHGGLHGGLCMGLCGGLCGSMRIYVSLRGSMRGSTQVYAGVYAHYNWLMVLELQMSITVCPWLPLVAHSNH